MQKTGRRNLEKTEITDDIGKAASCEDRLSGERPRDVVALDRNQNGKLNCAQMGF